ncbi:hypothetical protein C8R47DRAFT_1216480 [Mycena vitilis]|nr:hypothetical protein C8R47DRAFT_1216480 [Mycena vitilis]
MAPPAETTSSESTQPPNAATLAADAMQKRLDTEDSPGRKRKRDDDDEDEDVNGSFKDYGRAYVRLGDPFTPLDTIVQHGIFVETTEEIDYPTMNEEEREAFNNNTASWEILWRLQGQAFREQMIALQKNRNLRRRICAKITAGMNASRCEDANSLKKYVIGYLNTTVKITRGENHPTTAHLICPAKQVPNESTFAKIATDQLIVTGQTFRRFFYPDDWVYEKDPVTKTNNLMDRIFEGHLMPRVAKCILQGPGSALKPPGAHRGERGDAARIGARTVTPRLMGYLAYQTLLSISALETYRQIDGAFDYQEFYWTIVSLFDGGDNARILEHFNHQVFGSVTGNARAAAAPTTANEDDEDGESDLAAYKALRAAKGARLAEEAGTASSVSAVPAASAQTP